MTLSRRSLLKNVSLAPAAFALGSGAALAAGTHPLPEKWDKECDVVIIGGGGAAMQAAIQAHEAGGKVILCNKSANSYFTATALCGAAFTCFNSRMQREAGVHDSIDALVEDMLFYGATGPIPSFFGLMPRIPALPSIGSNPTDCVNTSSKSTANSALPVPSDRRLLRARTTSTFWRRNQEARH